VFVSSLFIVNDSLFPIRSYRKCTPSKSFRPRFLFRRFLSLHDALHLAKKLILTKRLRTLLLPGLHPPAQSAVFSVHPDSEPQHGFPLFHEPWRVTRMWCIVESPSSHLVLHDHSTRAQQDHSRMLAEERIFCSIVRADGRSALQANRARKKCSRDASSVE